MSKKVENIQKSERKQKEEEHKKLRREKERQRRDEKRKKRQAEFGELSNDHSRTAYRLIQKFGFLTPLALGLAMQHLHPGEGKFDPKMIDRIMSEVLDNTCVVERRKSPRKGRNHSEKVYALNEKLTTNILRNAIKLYCANEDVGVSNDRHRMMSNLFLIMEAIRITKDFGPGYFNIWRDTLSEYETQSAVIMMEDANGKLYPKRIYEYESMKLGGSKECDGLISYDQGKFFYWVESEGSYKNPDERNKIARFNEIIGNNYELNEQYQQTSGLVINSQKAIAGIVFIHGHESSFWDITRALDEYQVEVDQDGDDSSDPHHTIHHFLRLNARLGVEWFNFEEFIYPQHGDEPPVIYDAAEFKRRYLK